MKKRKTQKNVKCVRMIKCVKVRALSVKNKVRSARAEQLWCKFSTQTVKERSGGRPHNISALDQHFFYSLLPCLVRLNVVRRSECLYVIIAVCQVLGLRDGEVQCLFCGGKPNETTTICDNVYLLHGSRALSLASVIRTTTMLLKKTARGNGHGASFWSAGSLKECAVCSAVASWVNKVGGRKLQFSDS